MLGSGELMEGAKRQAFAVILAAGEGTRMRSSRPKPLARLCGKPMTAHIIDSVFNAGVEEIVVVVGFKSDEVVESLTRYAPLGARLNFVEQKSQRGTGDAVAAAMTALPDPITFQGQLPPTVLVLPGDTPLIRSSTLVALLQSHAQGSAAVNVAYTELPDASGYGRLIFGKSDTVLRIVEHKDASSQELEITKVNSSVYAFSLDVILPALRRLNNQNSQGEYYLTDVIEILVRAGYGVAGFRVEDANEVNGVNDRNQLSFVERIMRERINASFMSRGVNLVDPASIYIDSTVDIGQDVTIWPGTFLVGRTSVGTGAEIGPETRISNSTVGDGARVVRSDIEECHVGEDAVVGPYAVLRAGAKVPANSSTGSFVVLE